MELMAIKRDGLVHLLHLLLSALVGVYITASNLFDFTGELPSSGIPPVFEILVEAFALQCYVRTVPREDHKSHLEGFPTLNCQSMP